MLQTVSFNNAVIHNNNYFTNMLLLFLIGRVDVVFVKGDK